jgi:DNA-binding GntR family transcriptional regulator
MHTAPQGTPYQRLKEMILAGGLAPGDPLVERAIATQLTVSRTPVRAAIMRLEKEGLVRVVEGKGAFVADYSLEDMIEIYQMREGLEPLAARLACPRIDLKQLAHFEQALKRCRAKLPEGEDDRDAWRALGRDFHNLFIRASGNRRIIAALDAVHHQIELFRGLGRSANAPRLTASAVDEHLRIVEALKKRDAAAAERAVRTHLQNGLKARLKLFQVHT